MAEGVYPWVFWRSKQLSLNKFFDPSTPSMRKGCDGGKKNTGGKKREKKEKTDENSGHYVIASSRPPERQPLERRTLAPIFTRLEDIFNPMMVLYTPNWLLSFVQPWFLVNFYII